MPIRVLLADDQPLVRSGIAMLLAAEPDIEVVGECNDGASAIEDALRLEPDVVLMDVRMPGLDGVAATARLAGRTRVLILTTYHVDEAVYGALRAGAVGFLLKDAVPVELVMAVKAVAAGQAWLDPAVAQGLLAEFAARPAPGATPEAMSALTQREREVLILAAQGLSNEEIAATLVIGEATVKTHLGRVLMKLGVRDRTQAVVAAYRHGLIKP
ncbi:MAG TPA: response regulator transcription factor [Candidatus Limnocylindrales bacterium]